MSTTDTVENTPNAAEPTAEAHDHAHHDHDHDHAHHDHAHQHGPALNPEVTREVEVEIPADEVSKAFRTVIKRYQKQARIPGFRAGKVPETLIKSRFNDGIRQDVVEAVLPAHFRSAIDAQGIQPVSQPQVTDLELEDGKPLKFKAVFEVLPEIHIDGYQDVKVEKSVSELTDEEFNAELNRVIDSRSTLEPVEEEREIVDGDFAVISFKGQIQGEEPAAGEQPLEGTDVPVEVGGENTLAAFNDALRGSKPGQELKLEVAYPAEFGDRRLAGKTVSYEVEVKAIKKKISPELNDDFAKELGDYEGIEDFKAKLREHLANDKDRRAKAETRDKLAEALIAKFTFPVPESLVQNQVDARLDRGLRALAQQGMNPEDMRKLDFARLREAQRDSAVNEVKATLIFDKIAQTENVEVSDEELENELQLISLQTREPLETLRERLTNDGALARIREQLRREKTGNLLYERLA
ncbi:trigger factor [Silvibacterium dinghuense]|uniref:Trigger factor n=1 Tax=Silvibacterium dinghuense TaxID=1560006 RepID=A0A4V1NVS6_9BACT|nr:trigger factor [Silvibacterium dinghuense]RXS96952.1 trigger factor [Silvibacterium dinghuense]GGG95003.1 trigger factor [Silvibacterium dinghuense]